MEKLLLVCLELRMEIRKSSCFEAKCFAVIMVLTRNLSKLLHAAYSSMLGLMTGERPMET